MLLLFCMMCGLQQDHGHITEFELQKSTNVEVFIQKRLSLHHRHCLYQSSIHLFYVLGISNKSFENSQSWYCVKRRCFWHLTYRPLKEQRSVLEIIILICFIVYNLPSQTSDSQRTTWCLSALFLSTEMLSAISECLRRRQIQYILIKRTKSGVYVLQKLGN